MTIPSASQKHPRPASAEVIFLLMILLAGALPGLPETTAAASPFPGQVVGNIDKAGFGEPSGIVFHTIRKTLFIVGDEGDLGEMKTDGTMLRTKHFPSGPVRMDFEGITLNPATGLLYIAIEGAEAILEIDPEDLAIRRKFNIERTLDGRLVMAPAGQGIEGITFVPNPTLPHGGTFLVANQAFRLDDPADVSAVLEVEVPLADSSENPPTCRLLRQFTPGATDLSDLHYDGVRNRLYIISDSNNLLFVTTPAGDVIAQYTDLPGADQEGISFDASGNMYIAQDSGGIVKILWPEH